MIRENDNGREDWEYWGEQRAKDMWPQVRTEVCDKVEMVMKALAGILDLDRDKPLPKRLRDITSPRLVCELYTYLRILMHSPELMSQRGELSGRSHFITCIITTDIEDATRSDFPVGGAHFAIPNTGGKWHCVCFGTDASVIRSLVECFFSPESAQELLILGTITPEAVISGTVSEQDLRRVWEPLQHRIREDRAGWLAATIYLSQKDEKGQGGPMSALQARLTASAKAAQQEQGTKQSEGTGCFVATACYGTPASPDVAALRRFRDEVLLSHFMGRVLTGLYYSVSPPIARWLEARPNTSSVIKRRLLAPVAAFVRSRRESEPSWVDPRNGK